MKTTLLSLLIVCIMLPGYASQLIPSAKERKHTTRTDLLRPPVERECEPETKAFGMSKTLDSGAIFVQNSARADTIIVKLFETKGGSWEPFMKEVPFYQGTTTIIDEMEQWFYEGFDYELELKNIAAYDDKGRPTRLETHLYDDGEWLPVIAFEEQYNELGEIISDIMYLYDYEQEEWYILLGFRALEEYNENGALTLRIWEDCFWGEWIPGYKEEFILNEQDVIVEIIEYYYDELDETWEKVYRVVMELCENNMWQQGHSYIWNWFDEEWELEIKYVEFEWFDFSRMLLTFVHVMADAELIDDNWKGDDDVEWVNYMRMTAEYLDTGLPLFRLIENWHGDADGGAWQPDVKMEYAYDHLGNVTLDMFSTHDGHEWLMVDGFHLEMEYHDDGSIKSIIYNGTRSEYKNGLNPLLQFIYVYSDDTTDAPVVALPALDIKVYPNPASNLINVELPDDSAYTHISIISADGRIVQSRDLSGYAGSQLVSLDVSGLTSGIYFVHVQGSAGQQTTRFIKR